VPGWTTREGLPPGFDGRHSYEPAPGSSFAKKTFYLPDGKERASGGPGGIEEAPFDEAVDGNRTDADGLGGFGPREGEFRFAMANVLLVGHSATRMRYEFVR